MLEASPSLEARTVSLGLTFRAGGPDAVTDAIDGELERRKKQLERGANLLGTLGNNAPFIGLFGTVLGVIEAFHHLGDAQNKAAMGNVMAAIGEALVATGVGIFVAIPAVVAYNVIQQKVGDLESSVGSFRKLVTAALKVAAAEPGHAATGPAPEIEEAPRDSSPPAARASRSNGAAVAVEA